MKCTGPSRPCSEASAEAATTAAATRDGPSRLTSTAESRGESKLTAAAEWMTTSHSDRRCRPSCVQAEAVGGHITGHGGHPGGHLGVEAVPVLLA